MNGLERFRDHFAGHAHGFVIIGGTACDLAFSDVGLEFRATKDIDIVLCLERIDARFADQVWQFVRDGEYESLEAPAEQRKFYRFTRPRADGYPAMLELFARVPDVLGPTIAGQLTPIPFNEEASSLSAILMDTDYYDWTHAGRVEIARLPVVRPEHLIPLKAKAWLDLTDRSAQGQAGLSRHITKHRNDVFRLYAIIDPEYTALPSGPVRADMSEFIERVRGERVDMNAMGLRGMSLDAVLDAMAERFAGSA